MPVFSKPIKRPARLVSRLVLEGIGFVGQFSRLLGFRGLFDCCRLIGRFVDDDSVDVVVHPAVTLRIGLLDPYWLCYVPRWRYYEPEIERVLQLFSDMPATFIDAGANLGYWSILTSKFAGWRVYAIEAGSKTFGKLKANLELNGAPVTAAHRAVSEFSGQLVTFAVSDTFHAGAHVAETSGSPDGTLGLERVETISLDDFAKLHCIQGSILLKLDVEGQELKALKGAHQTLQGDTLVIFEEHGSQKDLTATNFLLESGFDVFFLAQREALPIKTAAEALQHLHRRTVGYNFAATRSDLIRSKLIAPHQAK